MVIVVVSCWCCCLDFYKQCVLLIFFLVWLWFGLYFFSSIDVYYVNEIGRDTQMGREKIEKEYIYVSIND